MPFLCRPHFSIARLTGNSQVRTNGRLSAVLSAATSFFWHQGALFAHYVGLFGNRHGFSQKHKGKMPLLSSHWNATASVLTHNGKGSSNILKKLLLTHNGEGFCVAFQNSLPIHCGEGFCILLHSLLLIHKRKEPFAGSIMHRSQIGHHLSFCVFRQQMQSSDHHAASVMNISQCLFCKQLLFSFSSFYNSILQCFRHPELRSGFTCPPGHCKKSGEHVVSRSQSARNFNSLKDQVAAKANRRCGQSSCCSIGSASICPQAMGRHGRHTGPQSGPSIQASIGTPSGLPSDVSVL
jgi:hypothetical protein